MIMIIGGSFQGKEFFAKQNFGSDIEFLDGSQCEFDSIFSCRGIHNFHLFVKRFLSDDRLLTLPEDLQERNTDIIIISDEIGYGIVPIDKTERLWREQTGRICCRLMSKSKEAYRVLAGIGTKIKG